MILYLVQHWLQINKRWWKFVIYDSNQQAEKIVPIWLVDAMVVFSRIQLTTDVLTTCIREKIPVFFIVWWWKYLWKLDNLEPKNVEVLYKHIKCALNEKCSLKYSKIFIESKIHNSKIMLKRWSRLSTTNEKVDDIVKKLEYFYKLADNCWNLDELRWIEWNASKFYYQWFARFLPSGYVWTWRNKRPPRDEVNALLSLWYTLLAQTVQMYIEILWLDPQIWFMHQPKDLRTLLVLDMMEMFRAWVVDDLVLKVLRKNIIEKDDFIIDKHSQTPVLLTDDGLKKFIDAYYKEVFKKSEYDNVLDGTKWVKLKYLEKTLEEFKKSLVDGEFEYKWFKLK